MKSRVLHPAFFTDVKVAALSPNAKVLLLGLWLSCDDYGRALYLPKLIAGEVFPLEQVDIEALLNEVIKGEFIEVYEVSGQMYYQVPSWDRWQKPKYRQKPVIPGPDRVGENSPNSGETLPKTFHGAGENSPPVFVSVSESVSVSVSEESAQQRREKTGRLWPWKSEEARDT